MVAEGVFSTGNLTSYCEAEDVAKVLQGSDLTLFGGWSALEARVAELVLLTRTAVESYAGRDFFRHEEELLQVDGSGSDRLWLCNWGVSPPLEVLQIEVDGRVLGQGEYGVYADSAMVRLRREASVRYFPAGVQNVEIIASWGYAEVPSEVRLAQAKIVAAELLGELSGEGAGVVQTRIGDYSVQYSPQGQQAGTVLRLLSEARQALYRYRPLRVTAV
jgi:hypothetical protein